MGKKTARDLAEQFGSIDGLMAADVETLAAIPSIGPVTAESVVGYFAGHKPLIERFKALGVDPVYKASGQEGAFAGRIVVLTGPRLTGIRAPRPRPREKNAAARCSPP